MSKKKEPDYFALFEKEASHWLWYFGLHDWRVVFYHDELHTGNIAETHMDYVGKCASMILAKGLEPHFYTTEGIKRTAFHEVCELLLGSLYCLIDPHSDREHDAMSKAGHEIIRRLENTVYRDLKRV